MAPGLHSRAAGNESLFPTEVHFPFCGAALEAVPLRYPFPTDEAIRRKTAGETYHLRVQNSPRSVASRRGSPPFAMAFAPHGDITACTILLQRIASRCIALQHLVFREITTCVADLHSGRQRRNGPSFFCLP